MKDRQILRFVSPKRNDWYRRRSWLPDEPSPLALFDMTIDNTDTWSDDSDEYDWSDFRYDGMSDDSINTSSGSSPENSDFSDEDVSREKTARRRKGADRRRKERSLAPKPDDRRAACLASSDRSEPNEPTNSALGSSERTEPNKAKPERAASNMWFHPRVVQMLTEEWDMDPRSHVTKAAETPKGKEKEQYIAASPLPRSSQVPESDIKEAPRPANGKAPEPKNAALPPSKRWKPPKPKNPQAKKLTATSKNLHNNAPKPPSLSNRDLQAPSREASSTQIGLGISTSTSASSSSTAADRLRKQQRPETREASSPETLAQRNLDASIRLFAKQQSRVSADAVKATQVSLAKKSKAECAPGALASSSISIH